MMELYGAPSSFVFPIPILTLVRILTLIMIKKSFLLLLLLAPLSLISQNLYFHLNDGNTASYNILDIRSTDFSNGNFRVFLWDGSTVSWDLADIARIDFLDITTVMTETIDESSNVAVYPNPSQHSVNIAFSSPKAGQVSIDILSVNGELVRTWKHQVLSVGPQVVRWDGLDQQGKLVSQGSYIFRISFDERFIASPVIIRQ